MSESSFLISLDEKGKKISSIGLSQIIQKSSVESFKKVIFVIGGAFGLPIDIKERSNLLLSLSDMTFTHTMVRLILAEQIYRACTITKGEKYHHGS
jgi:23S rRNA (pseudouridine1915-N3)-methyltransferase